jgi:hypothetical protein
MLYHYSVALKESILNLNWRNTVVKIIMVYNLKKCTKAGM